MIKSLVILTCFLTAVFNLLAQADTTREMRYAEIDSLLINGKKIDISQKEDIVVSSKDSLMFFWSLKVQNVPKDKFLFRVLLSDGKDTSSYAYHVTQLFYFGLPQKDYTFIIYAFDPMGKWASNRVELKFRVNDRESALIKEIKTLRSKSNRTEPVKKNDGKSVLFGMELMQLIIIGLIFILVVVVIVFVIVTLKFRRSKSGFPSESNSGKESKHGQITLPRDEYNRLVSDNSNQRAELSSLRGQIDALGVRGKELLEQNKDLQESLNRLNNSKLELEELQKQKDELFTMIIHDIKNPAALIKNLVQLLRSYDLTATEQQEVIDDIVETTARIVSLSQEVSRVLALEGSRMTLDLEEVPINEIIDDIVRTNSINAEMKSIELVKELAEELPGVQVDPQKIGEILDNLISNAIKFTQKGGMVKVSSSFDGENVQVDISDNGLGLSESDINNAFHRGSRLSAKPTGSESSTGLGLWIVKKLMEAHHGRVWVKSALGKGSTFSISLPLKQPV
jgi:signal transduction histidine kinase